MAAAMAGCASAAAVEDQAEQEGSVVRKGVRDSVAAEKPREGLVEAPA